MLGASRCALRVLLFAMCLGRSAGFIGPLVVSRQSMPARNEAVVLLESYPTLPALQGLLALVPITRTRTSVRNDFKSLIEDKENEAAKAVTKLGLLGSTVFLTSVYEMQYTTNDDVELRVACAVVLVAAGTFAIKAAFLANKATRQAEKQEAFFDKFIPLVAVTLGFVLEVTYKTFG